MCLYSGFSTTCHIRTICRYMHVSMTGMSTWPVYQSDTIMHSTHCLRVPVRVNKDRWLTSVNCYSRQIGTTLTRSESTLFTTGRIGMVNIMHFARKYKSWTYTKKNNLFGFFMINDKCQRMQPNFEGNLIIIILIQLGK